MLRLKRTAVAAREQRQPGYAAAVEAVAASQDESHYHLAREQFVAVEKQFPQPKATRPAPRLKRFALGDAVERTLSAVGITKELVQKITRKPCGCPARQRWLNQWGYRQQERIEKAVNKAAKWYGIT
jgi:hypothetical protein